MVDSILQKQILQVYYAYLEMSIPTLKIYEIPLQATHEVQVVK